MDSFDATMDRRSLLMPSLAQTMRLQKNMSQTAPSRSSIGMYHRELLDGPSPTSPTEARLLLRVLSAEAALEEYRAHKAAVELASRRLDHARSKKREYLLHAANLPPMNSMSSSPLDDKSSTISAQRMSEAALLLPNKNEGNTLENTVSSLQGANSHPTKTEQSLSREQLQQPTLPPLPRRRQVKSWDVSVSFPSKLYSMLDEAESEGHADIVSFLPDGKSFMIHKPDELARELLPKYFRTSRLSSLQKQFSLYGFRSIRSGPNHGAIRHECFQRDRKELVAQIRRKKQTVPGASA